MTGRRPTSSGMMPNFSRSWGWICLSTSRRSSSSLLMISAPKPMPFWSDALFNDLLHAVEGAAADEEDVLGVHLDKLLVGMLAAALGGHIGHSALQDLQQGLLHALAGNIAGDGGIFALSGDLIHLVDVNDAALRLFDVVVGSLDQAQAECSPRRRPRSRPR